MGFDNECIPNIHSLAGEYFCPVCRLLVYPNEALQSQCTHLYCKPCLTYIVSTTRACPYDGYLVTEADSKPLVESNKTLAETIGKITVHCLYRRSGCMWQGPLSECTTHCSACAFGNSPVVCNRCAVQIVHRQVQEHAQNCSGAQLQTQHSEGQNAAPTGTGAMSDQTQAATQVGTATTQAQSVVSSQAGQDTNAHANVTSQPHPGLQTAAPTAEQWYQQQQQYQQYYQNYPGYDPYQQHYQHYYPYQHQAVAQSQQPQTYIQPQHPQAQQQTHSQVQPQVPQAQPLSQPQPQPQPQPHPSYSQLPIASQPQNQAQFGLQQQTHPAMQPQSHVQQQAQPPVHGHPPLQSQSHAQAQIVQSHPQNTQMPQNQQPLLQMQHPHPQNQVQIHSQFYPQHHPTPQPLPVSHTQTPMHAQHPHPSQAVNQPQAHLSASAVTGHHSYPQPQPQQIQARNPHQQMDVRPQSGCQLQSQHPGQMQSQFPQQYPLRPPSQATVQNLQQPGLLPSHDQTVNGPPLQQLPVHSHTHQPGVPVHQRPSMQPVQPPMNQQYLQHQQPFSGQPLGPGQNQGNQLVPYIQQQLHAQSPIRPQGPPQLLQQHPQQNITLAPGLQNHQSVSGAPPMLPHGVPTQPYPQSPGVPHLRPMQVGVNQHSGSFLRTNNPVQLPSELHSGSGLRLMYEGSDGINYKGVEAEKSSQKAAIGDMNDSDTVSGLRADTGSIKNVKSENDIKLVDDENKAIGEAKEIASGGHWSKTVKEEAIEGAGEQKDMSDINHKQIQISVSEGKEMKEAPLLKADRMQEHEHTEEQVIKLQEQKAAPEIPGGHPVHGQVQDAGLLRPAHSVQVPDERKQLPPQSYYGPPVFQQHGHVPPQLRPLDPVHIPHSGEALSSLPEYSQRPMYKQPYGHEVLPAGIPGPGSTEAFRRGSSLHGRPPGPYTQGHALSTEVEQVPPSNQRNNSADGRRLDPLGLNYDMYSNTMKLNGALACDSSSTPGLHDDPPKPFPDERFIPLPQGPTRRTTDDDIKHFPHLDADRASKFGAKFTSSGSLDKVNHGVGMDIAQGQPGKVPYSLNYDSGYKFEAPASSVPSRFVPPPHHDGMLHPNDVGGSPVGFNESARKMSNSARVYPEYFGSGPVYGNRLRDSLVPRSPGGDYLHLSFPRFGTHPGPDDIGGIELNQFGEPVSSSFHDSKFHVPSGNFYRGEFESPGNLHLRSRRHDGLPHRLYRGEHIDPHELPSNLQRGEPFGFGAFPGHLRMGNLVDPGHPRFGEPGFRRNFAGDLEPYDNSRKRKLTSMGWCRICKVDCETVEGLDLHSQTREHQKMAMDMVLAFKQKAKKQKSDSTDRASLDDASKSKNVDSEDHGNKH